METKNTYPDEHACYQLTFNTVDWIDVFIRPVYKQIVVHTLNYFIADKGLSIYGWCLLSNHLHLIGQAASHTSIAEIEKEFKTFTTHKILQAMDTEPHTRKKWMMDHFEKSASLFSSSKKLQLWQQATSPVNIDIRKPSQLVEHIERIQKTPVRDRVVDIASDYLYSSARDYAGMNGLVKITRIPLVEQQLAALESMNGGFFVKYVRN